MAVSDSLNPVTNFQFVTPAYLDQTMIMAKKCTCFRFDMKNIRDVDSMNLLEMIRVRDDLMNLFKMTHLGQTYKMTALKQENAR